MSAVQLRPAHTCSQPDLFEPLPQRVGVVEARWQCPDCRQRWLGRGWRGVSGEHADWERVGVWRWWAWGWS